MKAWAKSKFLLILVTINLLFMLLVLVLNVINKPRVIACFGQNIFIAEAKYEEEGYFAYLIHLQKAEFKKFNKNKLIIYFPNNKCYKTIFFPHWNKNNELVLTENLDLNHYLDQTVLILLGQESLWTFIWNNITT